MQINSHGFFGFLIQEEEEERRKKMASITIPPVLTTPKDDAIQLYRAFKGFGSDVKTIINILAHRNATQRSNIRHEYKTMYSEGLDKRLASELRGDVKKAVLLWMDDPATRDAIILRRALNGDIVSTKTATEVICSRTPSQLVQVKQFYHTIAKTYLDRDIEYQCSGDHKKLLLQYLGTKRHEGPEIDKHLVENDVKDLYKAGEKRLGTDEKTFIKVFSERSRAHIAEVEIAYKSKYGHSLQKAVKKETSGNFEFGLLTILRCADNPGTYFAKQLHKAMKGSGTNDTCLIRAMKGLGTNDTCLIRGMKGLGTNDTDLIRIIVSRAEMDMQYIKGEYQNKYGISLKDDVRSETSGNYRDFLLALLGD